MGHGDPNAESPKFHLVEVAGQVFKMYELSVGWGMPPIGKSWHVASTMTELVTPEQWDAIVQASTLGWFALATAINATPAASWLTRVLADAAASGGAAKVRGTLVTQYQRLWAMQQQVGHAYIVQAA
jgi:hypothetical protein